MKKRWKTVKVQQELLTKVEAEVEKRLYKSLSEFVSDAIQHRLQEITKGRVLEYLERDSKISQKRMELLYTEKHLWIKKISTKNAKLGITDHLKNNLKEVINIQTSDVGEKVTKDDPFGVVESWWFTFDLYSPINGKIVAVNKDLIENPFILNENPFTWIVEIQTEQQDLNSQISLLGFDEYRKLAAK